MDYIFTTEAYYRVPPGCSFSHCHVELNESVINWLRALIKSCPANRWSMYTFWFVCTLWISLFLDDWSFCKIHCTEAATTVRSLSFHPDNANKSPKTTARQGLGLPICARSAAYKSNNPSEMKITWALRKSAYLSRSRIGCRRWFPR